MRDLGKQSDAGKITTRDKRVGKYKWEIYMGNVYGKQQQQQEKERK